MTAVDTISHLYLPLSLSMGEVAPVSLSSGVLMLSLSKHADGSITLSGHR